MAVSPFNFSVSESVQGVPCHLNWIQEFLSHLERTAFDKAKSLSQYLTLLLKEEFQTFGGRLGDYGDEKTGFDTLIGASYQISLGNLGYQLNISSFYCYLGDFDSALKHLECTQPIMAELENGSLELGNDRLSAVKYCLSATEWVVEMLMSDGIQNGKIAQESKKLTESWNTIQNNNRSKATINFFKAILGEGVRAKEEMVRDLFVEVASLDQDYFLWHHYAYKNVKKTRRCYKIGKLGVPNDFEKSFCEKAFRLRPNYLPIAEDYAQLLKDALWTRPELEWEANVLHVDTCLNVFKDALQIAEKDETRDGKFWLGKLKLHFGEFLLHGKGTNLDQKLGKQLYDQCLEAYPKCNWVLHKVGRLHYWGAYRTQLYQDMKKAEEYYLLSLKSEPTFPCLKDYRKLLLSTGRLQEFLEVTDRFMDCCRRDDYILWLLMDLGCVEFLYSQIPKEDVCRSWIGVLMKYPDHRKDACAAFKRRYWMNGEYSYIMRPLVINTIEKIKIATKNEQEIETISFIIDELERQEEEFMEERRQRNEFVGGMNRLRISSSSVGTNNSGWRQSATRSYQPRRPSEADLDNNWRS